MNGSILTISNETLNNTFSLAQNFSIGSNHNATTSIPYIDPNWFYSSLVQSAAAIVGLMGAFIVTKLINESSFFKHLKQDIEKYENKIQLISENIKIKKEWIEKADIEKNTRLVHEFLNSQVANINPEIPPTVDELYKIAISEDNYRDLNKDILEKEYNADYREYVKKTSEARLKVPVNLRAKAYLPFRTDSIDGLKYSQYKEEITRQQAEITSYDILLKDKKDHLKDNKDILNLRWYIIILFIFSIIGIFIPLSVMLFDYDRMMDLRFQTLAFFCIGWLVVIGYFYFEIRNLLTISK